MNPRGKLEGPQANTCEVEWPTHKSQMGGKMIKGKGNNMGKFEDVGVVN